MKASSAARAAADRFRSLPPAWPVEVHAPPDADGIAGAAVVARALLRAGRRFHVRFGQEAPEKLEPQTVHLFVAASAPDEGAGVLEVAGPARDAAPPPSFQSLSWATELREANWDLAPIALAPHLSAEEACRPLLEEAARRGHVALLPRLALPDARLEALLAALPAPWTSLLAPGEVDAFLDKHGLPPQATVHELPPAETERLASALALRWLRTGGSPEAIANLVAARPAWTARANLPLDRLATLLRAAAQGGEPGLALAFLLGDDSARTELEVLEAQANAGPALEAMPR